MDSNPPPLPNSPLLFGRWPVRSRLVPKLVAIAAVLVAMQIPLAIIDSKREERASRHAEAVAEVTAAWGGSQRVVGPILIVPYSMNGAAESRYELRMVPQGLQVEGALEPKALKRGIYEARVYTGALRLTGRFDREAFPIEKAKPHWGEARLVVTVSDARGLSGEQVLQWQGEAVALEAGTTVLGWSGGMHAKVPVDEERALEFELDLSLDGSGLLEFVPLAEETTVKLSSSWPTPSFRGAFLPKIRDVDGEGFSAEWKVGELGRNLPKYWSRSTSEDEAMNTRWGDMTFGVSLLPAVSDYLIVERAMKYGLLFFVTIFAGFFLFEVTGARVLHGLNYLLVGGAVCLFYLALLSLSEFWPFGWAYGVAASAATGLILLYAKAVLRDGRSLGVVTGELGGIFGYLFLVLRMEEMSLVAGTVLLFVLLGAIMYATRNFRAESELNEEGQS